MKRLRVAVIGTGNISNFHTGNYAKNEQVELIAACDLDEKRVREYCEKYQIPRFYTDYRELLEKEKPDAVSVCTWNNSHAEISIAALRAGTNVLCEKPLAMNTAEALEIEKTVRETGKTLMVGFVRRFGINTSVVQEFIKNGTFGQINQVKTQYIRRSGNPLGWFANKELSGGGPVIDLGVHVIDLARYLMGKPRATAVSAVTFDNIGSRPNLKFFQKPYRSLDPGMDFCNVEDMAVAMIRFDNGAVLNVELSFSQHIKDEEKVSFEMYGSKGGAVLEPKLEIFTEQNDIALTMMPQYEQDTAFDGNFEREICHFVDCVQNGKETLNPVEDGVEMMRIIDGIYESARQGQEIKL